MPAEVLVCKNTLMRIAADRVEGFSPLKEATKVRLRTVTAAVLTAQRHIIIVTQGDNAWVFVQEDHIAESVKVYLDFEKKLTAGLSKEAKEVRYRVVTRHCCTVVTCRRASCQRRSAARAWTASL